jgi:transcription factor TGA
MGSRTGAEDEKKAVVMPSFDPQLPISNAMYSSSSITFYIHVFN